MSYIAHARAHTHTHTVKFQFFIFVGTTKKWHEIRKHSSDRNYGHVARTKQKVHEIKENIKCRNIKLKKNVCVCVCVYICR